MNNYRVCGRKLARVIKQYGDIFSNISEGTAFLLQSVTLECGVCGFYSPDPRAEVYCFGLNFNISKLVY